MPTGLNRSAAGSWPPLSLGEQPGSSGSEPEDLKNPPPNPKHPRIPATLPAVAHGSLLPALHVGRLVARGRRRRLQHGALRRGELRRHQGAAGAERGGEGGLALLTHAWGRTEGISRGGAGCCRYPPFHLLPLQLLVSRQKNQPWLSVPGSLGFISSSCTTPVFANISGPSERGTPFPQWFPSAGGPISYRTRMGNGRGSDKVTAKGVPHGCRTLGRPSAPC